MAKINIPFDNKNYNVDESSLSTASSALRYHLQNVMNGTGATIVLDGVSYSISAAKLSAAEDAFAAYLATIDDEGAQMPEKNEYGFYYRVPYVCVLPDGSTDIMVLYEPDSGEFPVALWQHYDSRNENELFYSTTMWFEYNEANNALYNPYNNLDYVIGADGSFTISFQGEEFIYTTSFTETEHGVFYGDEYVNDSGDTMIFDENEVRMYDSSGNLLFVNNVKYGNFGHIVWYADYSEVLADFDMSGNILYAKSEDGVLVRFVRK
jgi:hypothetical protein